MCKWKTQLSGGSNWWNTHILTISTIFYKVKIILLSSFLKNTSKKQVHWNWQWWCTCHIASAANINVIAMMVWRYEGRTRWMRAQGKWYFNATFMNGWKPVWLLLLLHIFAHIAWKFYYFIHLASSEDEWKRVFYIHRALLQWYLQSHPQREERVSESREKRDGIGTKRVVSKWHWKLDLYYSATSSL